jgi:hypothetical protein
LTRSSQLDNSGSIFNLFVEKEGHRRSMSV